VLLLLARLVERDLSGMRRKTGIAALAVHVFFAAFFSSLRGAGAATTTVNAEAAAYVREGRTTDYSSIDSDNLYVRDNNHRNIFLRFNRANIGTTIPPGSTWDSVTLTLTCRAGGSYDGPIDILFIANDAWAPNTITFANMPAAGVDIGDWGVGSFGVGTDWTYAVDAARVKTELDSGDGLFSLKIDGNSQGRSGDAQFYRTSQVPYLTIQYTPPVTTTGVATTGDPTTAPPTTGTPTTGPPTTGVPTTAVPTTGVSTTAVPSTGAPTTDVPTTGASTGVVSTTATTTAVPTTAVVTTATTTAIPTTTGSTTGVGTPPGAASSEATSSGEPFPLLIVIIVAAVVLCLCCVALAVFLISKRSKDTEEAENRATLREMGDGGSSSESLELDDNVVVYEDVADMVGSDDSSSSTYEAVMQHTDASASSESEVVYADLEEFQSVEDDS
jgi:multisubunit Na+/H+ antiporter MnhC subunit